MFIARRNTWLLLPLLAPVLLSQTQASENKILLLKAGTVAVKQIQPSGTLLGIFPASTLSHVVLPETDLNVMIPYPVWDEGRGIYQTDIPGIGFSFCQQDGSQCLHNGGSLVGSSVQASMKNFAVRLYKTGQVQAGEYNLPALFTLNQAGAPLMSLGLNALRLNVSQCSITRNSLHVTFPDATLGTSTVLSRVRFHLPLRCNTPEDYDNMDIHFVYNGKRVDAQHIETSLPGIGLSVRSEQGKYVDFSAASTDAGAAFHETGYVAELSRAHGEPVQTGKFNVSVTAVLTMR